MLYASTAQGTENSHMPVAKTKQPKRVTIRTVAADAGVSVAAVSKVLRNAYGVSDGLRARVEASIEKLGYRPNVAARAMRGSTYTVGLLMSDIGNPFLYDLIGAINQTLEKAGYKGLIGVGKAHAPLEEQMIDSMIDSRMDGLILIAPKLDPDTLAKYAQQIPTVMVGHHEPDSTLFDSINSNDAQGAGLIVDQFLSCGYRDIAMMSIDQEVAHKTNVTDAREVGFLAAMEKAGLGASIMHLSADPDLHAQQMADFLDQPTRPRAVFCWSDLDAIALMSMALEQGIRVPQDLAIAGYDNSRMAALPMISLTTIDQSPDVMGVAAAEMLVSRIGGRKPAQHNMIAPQLLVRHSS